MTNLLHFELSPKVSENRMVPLKGMPLPGHVRKLPVIWGKAVVFARNCSFLHQVQLASLD